MATSTATIVTANASQYLVAVCRHASRINHKILARHEGDQAHGPHVKRVEWNDTDGTLELDAGRCRLRASPQQLTVHIDADDDHRRQQIEQIITRDLERYGRREHLTIDWHHADAPPDQP